MARRISAIAQHGYPGRECPSAHPLCVLPRSSISLQQATTGNWLRRDRWYQPWPRATGNERVLYRRLPRRLGHSTRSGRCVVRYYEPARHENHLDSRLACRARPLTRCRAYVGSRRTDRSDTHSHSERLRSFHVSEDQRPSLLCLRSRVGSRHARHPRRPCSGRTDRDRWCSHSALAGARCRTEPDRPAGPR